MAKINIKRRYVYIALVLAICTSMTTLFSMATDNKELPKTTQVTKKEPVVETEKKALVEEAEKETVPPAKATQPEKFEPQMPHKGEIIKDYHIDTLVYSNTLKDYRTHPGIDIKGQILDKVYSIEKGVVENAYPNALMGNTIIIDHLNGIKSIYSNLSTLEMVATGQEIKKGAVISGIGDTALLETGDEAHLHFEITKNGETINPLSVIKPE